MKYFLFLISYKYLYNESFDKIFGHKSRNFLDKGLH